MTGAREKLQQQLARQYTAAYGPFVSGDYPIGQRVSTHSCTGEIIWSYRQGGKLVYVVDDGQGWPEETDASGIVEVKETRKDRR